MQSWRMASAGQYTLVRAGWQGNSSAIALDVKKLLKTNGRPRLKERGGGDPISMQGVQCIRVRAVSTVGVLGVGEACRPTPTPRNTDLACVAWSSAAASPSPSLPHPSKAFDLFQLGSKGREVRGYGGSGPAGGWQMAWTMLRDPMTRNRTPRGRWGGHRKAVPGTQGPHITLERTPGKMIIAEGYIYIYI